MEIHPVGFLQMQNYNFCISVTEKIMMILNENRKETYTSITSLAFMVKNKGWSFYDIMVTSQS